jgi:murein DD-endopeptidase MepM/ murein hydrolase activator NlpD
MSKRMIMLDFKSSEGIRGLEENRKLPKWLKPASILVLVAVTVFISLQFFDSQPEPQEAAPVNTAPPSQISMPLALPGQKQDSAPAAPPETQVTAVTAEVAEPETSVEPQPIAVEQERSKPGKWLEEKVGKGDSLARIFSRLKLSATLLHNITHSGDEAKKLARIMPGELLRVQLDEEGDFLQLIHVRSPIESLKITPDGDSFKAEIITKELEKRVAHLSGSITNSLYESAREAGLSDDLIMDLAFIFGWDIDFALEIRSGDQFTLIFEEEYLEGEKYRNGVILAAEFVNRGKRFRAIRYVDEKGKSDYFSPDGKNMRKAFLRAPVDFRRISSRFSKSRWHPVLGKKRPHRGVDYAAPVGTPIKASGDGKIIHIGRKGGYGKTIVIQHSSRYTTLYGHLNGYRRGMKRGSRVKQGQTIGYLGSTGLSTGPHLHYEFRVNGVHRNPLTVKLPDATPIAKKYREDFTRKSAPLLSQLSLLSNSVPTLAKAPDSQ